MKKLNKAYGVLENSVEAYMNASTSVCSVCSACAGGSPNWYVQYYSGLSAN